MAHPAMADTSAAAQIHRSKACSQADMAARHALELQVSGAISFPGLI
jgi:hypothetical protein